MHPFPPIPTRRALIAALGLTAPAAADCPVVTGRIVAFVGQPLAGSVITELDPPSADGAGRAAFVVDLADGRSAVWHGDGLVWTSDQAPPGTTVSIGGPVGVGDDGGFIVAGAVDGLGAVWGHDGQVMRVGDPAPTEPPNFAITFVARPSMTPAGVAHWIAGTNDGMGGDDTFRRTLYRRTPDGVITRALRSFDAIGDAEINGGDALSFNYAFSDDLAHRVIVFRDRLAPNTNDLCVAIDETILAREGTPTGDGDLWKDFGLVAVNSAGHTLVAARTDAALPRAITLLSNGTIALRGDMVLDGVLLGGVGQPAINDANEAVFMGGEAVFFAADAADLASARRVITRGELFRALGDKPGDWIIERFTGPASYARLDLSTDGRVRVGVRLLSVETPLLRDAIIELPLSRCAADFNADGTLDFFDVQAFLTAFAAATACADRNGDGALDFFDVQRYLADYAAGCP